MPTMLQRGFGWGAGKMADAAAGLGRIGLDRGGAAGAAAAYASRGGSIFGQGLAGIAGANPAAARAVVGGVAGGMYGAVSDNTSVMGGAAMGAGLAAGAPLALGRAKGMLGSYRGLRDIGRGRGRALYSTMAGEAFAAKRFVGRTASKAFNRIDSTLKAKAGY